MALKRVITAVEQAALSAEMKLEYVAQGEGFVLSLTDYEDPAELRRARDREKEEGRVAKEALTTANAKVAALEAADPSKKTADIATLERSWQEKVTAATKTGADQVEALKNTLHKTLLDNAANEFASSMTKDAAGASLLKPHLLPRLEVVYDGDKPVVKIKDKAGAVSAMTFDELKTEFVATPTFATVVVGSKASGGGAVGGGKGGAGGAGGAGGKKTFDQMTGPEKAELFNRDPLDFQQQAADAAKARAQTRFA